MSIAVREYTDASQIIADAKARRAMFYGAASRPVVLPEPPAKPVAKPADIIKPTNGGPRWSPADVATLRKMIAAGAATYAISERVGRSEVAVYKKAEVLGLKVTSPFVKPAKERRRDPLSVYTENFIRDWGAAERAALGLRDVVEKTIAVVSIYTGVSRIDILSERRPPKIALARHIVCWLLRHETSLSFVAIGRKIGNRDHSTIVHCIGKIDATMTADWAFASDMRRLADIVRESVREQTRLVRAKSAGYAL